MNINGPNNFLIFRKVTTMTDQLIGLPAQISALQTEILNKQIQLEEGRSNIKKWELAMIADISEQLDSAGKPLYSNDTKRQAKLNEIKEFDADYIQSLQSIKEYDLSIRRDQISLEFLQNQQRNLRVVLLANNQDDHECCHH